MSTTTCCARPARLGVDYLELGNRHVTTFLTEMAALNWLPPDHYPRATEHIAQMQELIATLVERGHAYEAEGHVYFAVDCLARYGALSALPREAMLPIANERGNVPDMPGKRDPLDFVLWQRSLPDEPSWPSPWGAGRPGWHIECSAMAIGLPRRAVRDPRRRRRSRLPAPRVGDRPVGGRHRRAALVACWMHAGMLATRARR